MSALAGCQLAREGTGESDTVDEITGDRLIGIFITEEYLDLLDMEGYLNDNIGKISDGGYITVDGNNRKYKGRLYATLATRIRTNENTGKTFDAKEYVFDGVEGMYYLAATVPATEDEDSYTFSCSDAAVSDPRTNHQYGENENKITLEGTVCLTPSHAGKVRYINRVYQSADGTVYAISGMGLSLEGYQDEGAVHSQTIEETTTITENGKNKSTSISIKISFVLMFPPEQIVVLQMDRDSAILSRMEYIPGELPGTLTPEPGAEYIIVETCKLDREGNSVVSRSLFDKCSKNIETFYCRDDGICVKKSTCIDWSKD